MYSQGRQERHRAFNTTVKQVRLRCWQPAATRVEGLEVETGEKGKVDSVIPQTWQDARDPFFESTIILVPTRAAIRERAQEYLDGDP